MDRSAPPTDDERRAALVRLGFEPTLFEDENTVAPISTPAATAKKEPTEPKYGQPVEIVTPLSDQAWNVIAPFMPDQPNSKHSKRVVVDGMTRFVIGGTTWGDLGTVRGGFYSAARATRGRDMWRHARAAASLGITDETERRHFMRVCDYMLTGDAGLLAHRHGIARYLARVSGRARPQKEAKAGDGGLRRMSSLGAALVRHSEG